MVFDNVQHEKEKAMARFNRFRRIAKLWQFLEGLVVLGLIQWATGGFAAAVKVTGGCLVEFLLKYLHNHHVVFLIGNAIIISLFLLCRQSESSGDGGNLYDDYVKYSEVSVSAQQREPALSPSPIAAEAHDPVEESGGGDGEKQIVVRAPEAVVEVKPQCDDVAVAIEKAKRRIQRFERTQSEKLKREISVKRRRPELRRSETDNRLETVSESAAEVSEIETLSNEEFRRRVDAFIDKHWIGKGTNNNQFREYENYALLKMS
ncbi:hypothetical protein CASFOL_021351 [Castilleja foliolosa]|uniref:Uncharacterized protein n=1 Tax=Castilleja foliolosa TaxID=1961234 RepID=A0ABD3CXU7_9LAMI